MATGRALGSSASEAKHETPEMIRAADQAALEIRVTSSCFPAAYFFSTAVVTVGAAGGAACVG
jgi:hypothetical protein